MGYGVLLLAWVGANPPGSAPDEPAHHVKAAATASGQLTGTALTDLSWAPAIRRPFLAHVMQTFRLPAKLAADPRWACNAFTPEPAACLQQPRPPPPEPASDGTVPQDSILGPYPPAPYIVLGAAARISGSAGAALYAERLTGAAVSFALLTLAAVLVGGRWARVALILAVTPTVLFASSVVTTSGIEITAALAHAAAILGLRDRASGEGPWRAWAISGAALVLTRPLGLLWLSLYVAVLFALVGPARLRQRIRAERRAVPAVIFLALATGLAVGWSATVMPTDHASVATALGHLGEALRSFPDLVLQAVGVFGWLDVRLPAGAAWAVGLAWAAMIATAVLIGTKRDRVLVVTLVVGLVVLVIGVQAFTQLPFGFRAQARYVMPWWAGTLLIAGRTLDSGLRCRGAVRLRWAPPAAQTLAVGAAALHWSAWYVNARRSAVGLYGPSLFLGNEHWAPPLGWVPWLAAATAGAALLAQGARYCVARSSADVEDPAPL